MVGFFFYSKGLVLYFENVNVFGFKLLQNRKPFPVMYPFEAFKNEY
jgi:hypothetical protein